MTATTVLRHERTVETYAPGDVIVRAGEPGTVMYTVISGEVGILVEERLVEVVGPGGIVGELALIDGGPRSATVVARSYCQLGVVDAARFARLTQETPHFALGVMRVLAARLRRQNATLQPS
jgi:CRP/FNR family transcriptional regulator, cyclic AMP receptor protein